MGNNEPVDVRTHVQESVAWAYTHLDEARVVLMMAMGEARKELPNEEALRALTEEERMQGFVLSALSVLHACLERLLSDAPCCDVPEAACMLNMVRQEHEVFGGEQRWSPAAETESGSGPHRK